MILTSEHITNINSSTWSEDQGFESYWKKKTEIHTRLKCTMSGLVVLYIWVIFSGPQGSWIVCCLHLKIEFRSCARGRPWCGIFHWNWCTASIKLKLLFFPYMLCFLRAFPFISLIMSAASYLAKRVKRLVLMNPRMLVWYRTKSVLKTALIQTKPKLMKVCYFLGCLNQWLAHVTRV